MSALPQRQYEIAQGDRDTAISQWLDENPDTSPEETLCIRAEDYEKTLSAYREVLYRKFNSALAEALNESRIDTHMNLAQSVLDLCRASMEDMADERVRAGWV